MINLASKAIRIYATYALLKAWIGKCKEESE